MEALLSTGVFDHGVFPLQTCVRVAGAAMLVRALAKGDWLGNLCAVLFLQRNEMS